MSSKWRNLHIFPNGITIEKSIFFLRCFSQITIIKQYHINYKQTPAVYNFDSESTVDDDGTSTSSIVSTFIIDHLSSYPKFWQVVDLYRVPLLAFKRYHQELPWSTLRSSLVEYGHSVFETLSIAKEVDTYVVWLRKTR